MDAVNSSAWISLASAAIVVFCMFITAPVLISMYIDTKETQYKTLNLQKKIDNKLNKMENESNGRRSQKEMDISDGTSIHGN